MPYEIIHTIGSTVYFVFCLLFLWVSRIPRTNPGAGWWSAAMLFALLARLSFLVLTSQEATRFTVTVYSSLNVIEKLFLVTGIVRFFDLPLRPAVWLGWAGAVAVGAEVWLLIAWLADVSPLVRGLGVAVFNAASLAYVAWTTYRQRHVLQPQLMLVASAASAVLVLHWLTAFPIMEVVPSWFVQGYLLGTVLVMVQYFALLAAVLMSFQKRLLAAESSALDMAFQDPLTGLNNLRYMNTLFDKVLILATRPHQLVAIIYIDLDNFKPINDRAGHAVGDEVLKTVASRLRKAVRSTDICARIGGDEFVVICTQLEHAEQAHDIATKLLAEVTTVITVESKDYVVGASMGISLYPLHGKSLPQLLEYADQAMYETKRHGKNGYRIHSAQASEQAGSAEQALPAVGADQAIKAG